jgi:hypothetical protein
LVASGGRKMEMDLYRSSSFPLRILLVAALSIEAVAMLASYLLVIAQEMDERFPVSER